MYRPIYLTAPRISHFLLSASAMNGLKGMIEHANWAKRNLDETRTAPGAHVVDPKGAPTSVAASMGDRLAVLADPATANNAEAGDDTFASVLSSFAATYQNALDELKGWNNVAEADHKERNAYSVELLEAGLA